MDIEDEYTRDFSFEPEFITRKDSLQMHRSRLERTRKHNKIFKIKTISLDIILEKALVNEQQTTLSTQNIVEAEVEAFRTMYGRYTKDLSEYAKDEARRLKQLERQRKKDDRARNKELLGKKEGKFLRAFRWFWKRTFARMGEDWIFLALLGIIMAIISYCMDKGISMCTNARVWLYRDLADHPVTQYFAWITLPVCLILFSAGFVHLLAPQSIGSGIPEMKTILRGVQLKEYLTFKTLVAKVIGLTATLGSGMPLGKEGPFVHIASIVAQLLSKLVTSFQGIFENESRNTEMLAAACAVGVGSCFAAPVGGVLFSIEVTTTYFAVRNYWRGFFGAVCGATFFRLLAVWFQKADTLTALFLTSFHMDFPYDPQELIAFAMIGVISGLGGAAYVWIHRQYVLFMRSSKRMNNFLQKNRFLYPGILALMVATLSYPNGLGRYIAGELSTHEQVSNLFTNFTWSEPNLNVEQSAIVRYWTNPYTNEIFSILIFYLLYTFFVSIVTSTIPVPSGIFIPVFKIGAALGRIIGESMHLWFPTGIRYGGHINHIIPGGYAVVGASAFAGAVTHTVSVGVIVFEMTGQISHLVPVMIATLISCAIATILQPSMYDSIILIKKLPYLPDLLPTSSGMYNFTVEDFMVRDIKYIWQNITYQELKEILKKNKQLRSLPLVDNPDTMILLGSVQRFDLIKMIDKHIGREKRLEMAARRKKEAEEREEQERIKKLQEGPRRASRFEVVPAPDIVKLRQIANNEMLTPQAKKESNQFTPVFGTQPKKSILKKTNSFTMKGFSPLSPHSPVNTPYSTITGAESRLRSAFDIIFRKSATLQDVQNNDPELGSKSSIQTPSIDGTPYPSSHISKKVQLPRERVIDMSAEEQKMWEMEEMSKPIDLDAANVNIDPSPFQLVRTTSLLKVHSLFSMIGINHAYVTHVGRLVGVVALKELRKAIEDVNSGNLVPKEKQQETKIPETPISPCAEPLLNKELMKNEKEVNNLSNTVNSVDSLFQTNSNSENCSTTDIELDNIRNNLRLK
ncbi:hypothetical protein PVAND_002745 [Polypedilum vanderplanki]|uniref:Chloride channel protein n=1 Tax=Polypedilum vanderplanki TaxID=319348 RepID=A0A9J6BS30_POLVA|nr:hypothetical protein PVAND_002745 [Polypedilum vanderplanki]